MNESQLRSALGLLPRFGAAWITTLAWFLGEVNNHVGWFYCGGETQHDVGASGGSVFPQPLRCQLYYYLKLVVALERSWIT
jgi:hypothetical protein